MRHHLITSIAVLCTIFGLTACAERVAVDDAGVFDDFGLSIGGNPVETTKRGILLDSLEEVLDDVEGFKDLDLTNPAHLKRLAKIFNDIENGTAGRDVPEIFQGPEGIATIMAFKTVALKENVKAKGKIRDYFFDNIRKSGRLGVDMRIDRFDSNDVLFEQEFLHWDVQVNDDTYKVILREDDNPNDPFPGTVTLPDPKKDPSNPDSIWARGLDHKLFAKGKNIKVLYVSRKINDGPVERLDPARYASYYQSTDNSCIDMIFAGYPRAVVLPPQIGYCLGRCKHPDIINSN